jgi:two-component system KDP operon response regulator KdpE
LIQIPVIPPEMIQQEVAPASAYVGVLLVEADPKLRRGLRAALTDDGHRVHAVREPKAARRALTRNRPEVAVVGLARDDDAGLELVRQLRDTSDYVVIALLSRRDDDETIRAFDAGADDVVVVKPVNMGEFLARVRAAARRARRSRTALVAEEVLDVGAIRVDVGRHEVNVEGRRVHLTPIEFQLLLILARERGRCVRVERLLEELWPFEAHEPYHLRVHMSSLRRKVERDSGRPRWILTNVGVGYRIDAGE